jgi:hypothetical protein
LQQNKCLEEIHKAIATPSVTVKELETGCASLERYAVVDGTDERLALGVA